MGRQRPGETEAQGPLAQSTQIWRLSLWTTVSPPEPGLLGKQQVWVRASWGPPALMGGMMRGGGGGAR